MLDIANVKFLIAFFRGRIADMQDEGATAVEYGLLVSLIAIVVIAGVTAFGTRIAKVFTDAVTALH